MRQHHLPFLRTLALGFALGGSVLAQDVNLTDRIVLQDGTEIQARVTKMDSTGVAYLEKGSKSSTVKPEQVADIVLGDWPATTREGDAAVQAKDYDRAMARYAAALKDIAAHKARDLFRQYLHRKNAAALRAKGDFDGALEALQTLRKDCGDCWLRAASYLDSIAIARQKGDEAAVQSILTEMKSQPPSIKAEGDMETAAGYFRKKDYAGALKIYEGLEVNPSPSISVRARIWRIRSLRILKKYDDLEKACAKALQTPKPSLALAQTANSALGDVYLARGASDPTKLRDAMVAYARAIALGPPSDEEAKQDHALALLNSARGTLKLAERAATDEAKQQYRKRAASYFSEVNRWYKGTEWAEAAEKEMGATRGK